MGRRKQPKRARQSRRDRPALARYPSIDGPTFDVLGETCIAFEKYDGSNLQFKWTQSDGWCQFGTRKRTIDTDNRLFGSAIHRFHEKFATGLLTTIRRHKEYRNSKSIVAFCEFFGENTFSGLHHDNEERDIKLFDILLDDGQFVSPFDFAHHFGHLDIAPTVYEGTLTRQFIEDVRRGAYTVGEGVVAKGVTSTQRRRGKSQKQVWMAKVKTQTWLDELQRRAGDSPDLAREFEDNLKQQITFPTP